jgi:tetratricopeptide (TPR) repeat protein
MKTTYNDIKQTGAVLRGRPRQNSGRGRLLGHNYIKSCVVILCLTFVPLNLLLSLTNLASANTAAKIQQPLPENGLSIPEDSNNPALHQLLRAQISAIDTQKDQQGKESQNKLNQLIEQVRSVRFGPDQKQGATPSAAPAKTTVAKPPEKGSGKQVGHEDANTPTESESRPEQITTGTLQTLEKLLQHPEKVHDPLDLGEVLFSSGNLKDAAAFYREALKRIDPNDAGASGDRAWVLFQIGNCLRTSDRPAASKVYAQLQTEYPQSPWAGIAGAEGKLINWYLKDDPGALISPDKVKRPSSK